MQFAILPAVFHVTNEKKKSSLTAVFHVINENFSPPCPFIWASPCIRDLRGPKEVCNRSCDLQPASSQMNCSVLLQNSLTHSYVRWMYSFNHRFSKKLCKINKVRGNFYVLQIFIASNKVPINRLLNSHW